MHFGISLVSWEQENARVSDSLTHHHHQRATYISLNKKLVLYTILSEALCCCEYNFDDGKSRTFFMIIYLYLKIVSKKFPNFEFNKFLKTSNCLQKSTKKCIHISHHFNLTNYNPLFNKYSNTFSPHF